MNKEFIYLYKIFISLDAERWNNLIQKLKNENFII